MKTDELVSILAEIPEKNLLIFDLVDTFLVGETVDFEKAIEQAEALSRATDEVEVYCGNVKIFTRSLIGI